MTEQTSNSRTRQLRSYHDGPANPLVLPNARDAGSAAVIADAGARAITTTSGGAARRAAASNGGAAGQRRHRHHAGGIHCGPAGGRCSERERTRRWRGAIDFAGLNRLFRG